MHKEYIINQLINQSDKDKEAAELGKELQYINPKNHRYFCKVYKFQTSINEIGLLLKDMQDYQLLMSNQYKKITKFIQLHHLNHSFNSLLITALQYYHQFTIQNTRFIHKIAKTHLNCYPGHTQMKEEDNRCTDCKGIIGEYRVKQIKQELKLNKFQDKCNFYNVDNLNYTDLIQLRRQSNCIVSSELGTSEDQLQMRGTCLSLQQYDEVLNLLGSDLHQKNTEIQKIIHYFNEADRKFIEESTFKDRQSEQQMTRMQKLAQSSTITNKLNSIIHLFFKKYYKAKASKRRDMQLQVNIKDNQVIKELQKEKKGMKGRIYQLTADKEKLTLQYQNKIKLLQIQISSNTNEFKQKMAEMSLQYAQLSKKYAEQFNLHEIHKKELESVTDEYTNLMAMINRRSTNLNSRERSTSKKKTRIQTKKSRSKGRIKNSIKKLPSNYTDLNDQEDSDEMADTRKASPLQNTQKEITKFVTCQKIDEKHQEEEIGENISKLIGKKQASRFKALINHFNSNSNIGNEDRFERLTIGSSSSLQVIKTEKKKSNIQLNAFLPQIRVLGQVKQGAQQRNNILFMLFESQKEKQQLKIKFPSFLQLYNSFITNISSQKVLARSSSLGHSQTQQHFRQRVSILNENKYLKNSTKLLRSFEKSSSIICEMPANEQSNEISKGRVESSTKKSSKQERLKLDLLNKKSQYYLKKSSKKSIHDFSYSKTAQNTLRNNKNLTSNASLSKQIEKAAFTCELFTNQQIKQLFINETNMSGNRVVSEPISKDQNQNLMNILTELANIHLNNKWFYEEIKSILSFPKQIINHQNIDHENHIQIKNRLRYIIDLHKGCKREKGKNCIHLFNFIEKIKHVNRNQ